MVARSYLRDQASDEEYRLGRMLDKADLFFELNLDEDDISRTQDLYARVAALFVRVHGPAGLIRKYPALTLTTLIGHAGLAYEQGRFWESFWDELDTARDTEFENTLRQSLSGMLQRFGLRQFPEIDGSYVRVMTMHAGIPVHCLGDLVDVIEEHLLQGRDATAASLLEWLTEPGMEYRLNRLDVPVRNFLQLGGEIAVDVLDRIIEFLHFTADQPEVWNNLELDTSTTGLPTLILEGLIDRLQERPLGQAADKPHRAARRRNPGVVYSLSDDQVMVGVPYPDSSPAMPWKVSFDGDTREVYAERGWGVDEDGEHPLTLVSVTTPAREVHLRHDASGAQHQIPLVDKRDPLLIFNPDGRPIQRQTTLPRGVVLAVYPHDAEVVDGMSNAPVETLDDARAPSGWRGWRAVSIDLSEHASVRLRRSGSPVGPARTVRAAGAPRYENAEPVEGLKTSNGLSVYSERPTITLPANPGGSPQSWHIRARRAGAQRWLVDEEWESDTENTYVDPFEGVAAGLLGSFEVVVGGSLEFDLRQTLFLAEGVKVNHGVEFRRPVAGGLSTSISAITCLRPLTADHATVSFGLGVRESQIRLGDGERAFKLVLRPPYFESRIDPFGAPAQWRTTAQVIAPSDLEAHGMIAARIPGDVEVSFALRDLSGEVLHEEVPEVPRDNLFQLSTRTFVDTARTAGVCQLVALIDDLDGRTQSVVIAHVRPARLCSGVHIDDGRLVFADLADEADLAAFVWMSTAPWIPVRSLTITGGSAELPEDLRDSGQLIVQVFVDDPWVTITRPRRPDWSAFRVEQQGWVRDEDLARENLSRFLAGESSAPTSGGAMDAVWSALAVLPASGHDDSDNSQRRALVRILSIHPRSALEALGDSTIPSEELPAMLVRTGLARSGFSADFTENDLHPNPWVGCLVELSDLNSLNKRRDEVAEEREATLAYLKNQGGQMLLDLLAGKSRDASVGVFERDTQILDAKSPADVDEIFEYCRLVPGALLDPDTRMGSTIEAFHARREWLSEPVSRGLSFEVQRALPAVKRVAPLVYDAIRARNEVLDGADTTANPWLLLSMQSLTLAALARLEARGAFNRPMMNTPMTDGWIRMAEMFPSMVTTDLLIADALASYVRHGDLIGDWE
ncbi:hypothetical protein [Tomitella biformata]|uniref:hypothetical protein n=1 Tax=Tomitella biformata TaxID=630403 RepID=UPI0004643F87|nr:hypothetical protein [Tomitella biformata]